MQQTAESVSTGAVAPRGSPLPSDPGRPQRDATPPATSQASIALTWVGHSTFLVEAYGLNLLTDPVWASGLPMRLGRVAAPGIAWQDLPPIDAVLVSHDHSDHLNRATLRRLPRDTPLLLPRNAGHRIGDEGFTDVRDFDWWDSLDLEGVRLTFTPARHWTGGGFHARNRPLAGGWVVEPSAGDGGSTSGQAAVPPVGGRLSARAGRGAGGGGLFFAGDTGLGPHFREIGRRHPGLDLALLPIGSYTPHWGLGHVHINPEQAVQAFLDLAAARFVPMHWGTFRTPFEPMAAPRRRLLREWERRALSPDRLWDLAIGDHRSTADDAPSGDTGPAPRARAGPASIPPSGAPQPV